MVLARKVQTIKIVIMVIQILLRQGNVIYANLSFPRSTGVTTNRLEWTSTIGLAGSRTKTRTEPKVGRVYVVEIEDHPSPLDQLCCPAMTGICGRRDADGGRVWLTPKPRNSVGGGQPSVDSIRVFADNRSSMLVTMSARQSVN